jgi:ankyrin repeat protein
MIACEKGYIELVAELILLEAQVNLKDKKGRTPLFYALEAHGENVDVVV